MFYNYKTSLLALSLFSCITIVASTESPLRRAVSNYQAEVAASTDPLNRYACYSLIYEIGTIISQYKNSPTDFPITLEDLQYAYEEIHNCYKKAFNNPLYRASLYNLEDKEPLAINPYNLGAMICGLASGSSSSLVMACASSLSPNSSYGAGSYSLLTMLESLFATIGFIKSTKADSTKALQKLTLRIAALYLGFRGFKKNTDQERALHWLDTSLRELESLREEIQSKDIVPATR